MVTLSWEVSGHKELAEQILELKQTVGNHNEQLNQIYDALENLLDDKVDKTINKKNEGAERKNWF